MNDTLGRRLLNLFPMRNLAAGFETEKKNDKDAIISQILAANAKADILTWVHDHFELAKHHIHVLTPANRINAVPSNLLLKGLSPVSTAKAEALFLLDLTYTATVRSSTGLEERVLKFKWPVKICFHGDHILVKLIIMEKKLASYLDDEDSLIGFDRDLEEKAVALAAQRAISQHQTIEITDLNKGVKALWDADFIDSCAAQWTTEVSVASQKMHTKCYLKQHRPDDYAELMKSPLRKTLFEAMKKAKGFTNTFAVDPQIGTITFSTFSEDPNHACHVVGKILENN